ncbi:MAG: hypothetical protein ACLP6E_03540 [Acidimicrobiales bacterium]
MDPRPDSAVTDTPDAPAQRRELPGPSVKLALIVLLLGIGIVTLGFIAQVFTGSNPPVAAPSSVPTAKGSPIKAIPASSALAPLVSSGEPPNDIVNAIVLPAGSVPGAVTDNTNSAESYDEQREFEIDASEQKVITFFEVELPAQGWHVESTGKPKNQPGYEVLAQRAGSDGYYWEIGAVVSPTSFTSSAANATGVTSFEVRLFQVSDTD